jgi:GT2 family glycosyltransferase
MTFPVRLCGNEITEATVAEHRVTLGAILAGTALDAGVAPDVGIGELAQRTKAPHANATPLVTVAVCTRDRADDLARCLDALCRLDYPTLDFLVVDNAPATDAAAAVAGRYPAVRYVREPRAGLNWARNRAILECRGELLAFTDDDAVADPAWVTALVAVFAAAPQVMAVTGLVVPFELATPAQRTFEAYGGFGRGARRRWFRARPGRPAALEFGGAGAFGTGANMAYRRELFAAIGGFDPALDVGTVTNGGGDLEMFFRVLKHGHTLVYEPAAVVKHRHRREMPALRTQIANNGVGFYAYLTRTAMAYPDERVPVIRLGAWWFAWWSLRRLARALAGRETVPLTLVWVELVGSLRGPFRYRPARAEADSRSAMYPNEPRLRVSPSQPPPSVRQGEYEAVRTVDVANPLEPLANLEPARRVHVFVFWRGHPLGRLQIDNRGRDVPAAELRDAIAHTLGRAVLDPEGRIPEDRFWDEFAARLTAWMRGADMPAPEPPPQNRLDPEVGVSVIVATRDRPDDLRACLASLVAQRTARAFEIIVVDNNPASGVTPGVVSGFAGVRLVSEPRAGLSYARNRGIVEARGAIIATTDDDVCCPEDWIERLVAPFSHQQVAIVTGNVLPLALDTPAQQLFEMYGGLGRGYRPLSVGPEWMGRCRLSVPTWELGCTANAAFRASLFRDPRVGLMHEALGAGTPTGCSEDTWVFYTALRAGYSLVYEPRAYVWHRHRQSMDALRRQIYAYSKGHVAYQLLTLLVHRDVRALVRLAVELPLVYARRLLLRALRRTDYPARFVLREILGNLAGPWALWRSLRRVRALGRSPSMRNGDAVHVDSPGPEGAAAQRVVAPVAGTPGSGHR